MSQKKNILFLASWYPSKIAPKNGNFVQKHGLAASLYANIIALHACSKKQNEKFTIELNQNEQVSEYIVYYKKITSKIPFLSNYIKYKRQLAAYQMAYNKIIEKFNRIDLIHLNITYPAGIFALKLHKKYKLEYIISENWTAFLPINPYKFSRIESYFIKKIGNNAAYICPVSEDLKNAFISLGIRNRYKIVPNVVDEHIFKLSHKERDSITKFLHISNFKEEHKNMSGILRVIKKMSEATEDFVFTIAGDGDVELLRKQAANLKIPDKNIKIEGNKSTEEVAELMRQNDVFVLFSHYENLPCVISEAFMTGMPVISTDVGGIDEMINDKNGILIKDNDESGLLEKLLYFMQNKDKYNAEEIRNAAVNKYSMEVVGKKFYEIYEDVLNS